MDRSRAVSAKLDQLLGQLPCYNARRALVKDDTYSLLVQTRSLDVRIGTLVRNNGTQSQLLQLFGTVPIFYKGGRYNIPVSMWIVEAYPAAPPTCYVTPTNDMRIKHRHKHVDHEGIVYLEYLHSWKQGVSNLAELVLAMSSVFSEDPPVYRHNPHDPVPSHNVQRDHQRQLQQQHGGGGAGGGGNNYYNNNNNNNNHANNNHSGRNSPAASVSSSAASGAAAKKERLVARVTEKLGKDILNFNRTTTEEINSLMEQQDRLQSSVKTIDDGLAALKQEREQLTKANESTKERIEQVTKWLEENENSDKVDLDAAVVPRDTWSRQMFDAVAGDLAIEDTLYTLDKALNNGRIDLKTFLRHVRRLSEKQFMLRALARTVYLHQHKP